MNVYLFFDKVANTKLVKIYDIVSVVTIRTNN